MILGCFFSKVQSRVGEKSAGNDLGLFRTMSLRCDLLPFWGDEWHVLDPLNRTTTLRTSMLRQHQILQTPRVRVSGASPGSPSPFLFPLPLRLSHRLFTFRITSRIAFSVGLSPLSQGTLLKKSPSRTSRPNPLKPVPEILPD